MASLSGQHVVNIHELSASTEEKLQMLPPLSSECCIYSAPHRMRVSNEQHFTPRIVSIGPIQFQKKKLLAMEHQKERYLANFLRLAGLSLEECLKLTLENEARLRNSYANVIELESETFVKMILVDAAFLIMILVLNIFGSLIGTSDRPYRKPFMINGIRHDMVLLENQLPFFILEDLYQLSKLHYILEGKFPAVKVNKERAMTVFAYRFLKDWISLTVPERNPPSKAIHILALLRSCFIQADWIHPRKRTETTNMPSVKELYEAGVKIQVGSEKDMFDIRFHDGVLEIPPIKVYDFTETGFRNLLAFELCHCPKKHIFSDYFEMMRLLTLSSPDVELLTQNGVIENSLPNAEAVRTLFHNINIGTILFWDESPYSDVIKGLIEYYKVDWHRWKATWKQKYFKAPWAIFSFSAALLLLVISVVQTVFTILQVTIKK